MSAPPSHLLVSLRENVDRFMTLSLARHRGAMACRAGCASCCAVDLTVFPVEAAPLAAAAADLGPELRAAVRARAVAGEHCAFLVADRCAVYEQRPIICRTQGLALSLEDESVTACPKNFDAAPELVPVEDRLHLPRLNMVLSMLHRSWCAFEKIPEERVRLADIAESLTSRP